MGIRPKAGAQDSDSGIALSADVGGRPHSAQRGKSLGEAQRHRPGICDHLRSRRRHKSPKQNLHIFNFVLRPSKAADRELPQHELRRCPPSHVDASLPAPATLGAVGRQLQPHALHAELDDPASKPGVGSRGGTRTAVGAPRTNSTAQVFGLPDCSERAERLNKHRGWANGAPLGHQEVSRL